MDKRKAPEIAVKYINFLRKEKPKIKRAFLFGSYARGMQNDDSDMDLAIVFDNIDDTFDLQVELMKLRRRFDTRIEPHVFLESEFNNSNPLAGEILRYGIDLF
jgi:uncharacterized protein